VIRNLFDEHDIGGRPGLPVLGGATQHVRRWRSGYGLQEISGGARGPAQPRPQEAGHEGHAVSVLSGEAQQAFGILGEDLL
jgi:hypothetical protein